MIARQHAGHWVVSGIVLLCGLLRAGLLDVPLERDEGEYAYTARLMLEGVPPYAQAYNMKLPGIYAAYAVLMTIFGETHRGIHLGLLVMNGATIVLVHLLGRKLFDDFVGVVAAASFGLLSLGWTVQGLWANAEMFVLPFAIAGLLCTLHGIEAGRALWLVAAGLLLGVGFMMKQHGIFFIAGAGLFVLVEGLRGPTRDLRSTLARAVLLGVTSIVPYLVTCLALLWAGVFDAFWFWTFEYARVYSDIIPLSEGPARLARGFLKAAPAGPLLWLMAAAGLGALFFRERVAGRRLLSGLFAGVSIAALLPGLYFRPHYFLLVLPAAALLVGVAARAATDLAIGLGAGNWRRYVGGALAALALGHSVYQQRSFLFEKSPVEISRAVYGLSPFPESLAVADFLRASSDPQDRIAILGSEPQIPFYANRRKASGYLYIYPLMEDHEYALRMQQEMIGEIEASRPRFLVFVNVVSSWQRSPRSRGEILEWLDGYVRNFQLVGRVQLGMAGTRFFSEQELGPTSSCAENCVDIFERLPDSS